MGSQVPNVTVLQTRTSDDEFWVSGVSVSEIIKLLGQLSQLWQLYDQSNRIATENVTVITTTKINMFSYMYWPLLLIITNGS